MLEGLPNDSFLLFALGKEYASAGNAEKAISYFEKLKEIDPDYIGLYYHLAATYIQGNQIEAATQTIQLGVALADRIGDAKNKAELLQLAEAL